MRSLEWIKAENERVGRTNELPADGSFAVTADEAASLYRGYAWCEVGQFWFENPQHYYQCESCRNTLLKLRAQRLSNGN